MAKEKKCKRYLIERICRLAKLPGWKSGQTVLSKSQLIHLALHIDIQNDAVKRLEKKLDEYLAPLDA